MSMSRFIPGDYVRPSSPYLGLPRDSVWVIKRYHNKDTGTVELHSIGSTGRDGYPPSHVIGRVFADCNFEKVIMVDGLWKTANPQPAVVAPVELGDELGDEQLIAMADPVKSADKLVEQAAATLDAAKRNARKAREEREAISIRLHKDRGLAVATVALIAELSRLHNGGAEQTAASSIAEHAEQLQPIAKSYGYKIAKPGVIAIVVKA